MVLLTLLIGLLFGVLLSFPFINSTTTNIKNITTFGSRWYYVTLSHAEPLVLLRPIVSYYIPANSNPSYGPSTSHMVRIDMVGQIDLEGRDKEFILIGSMKKCITSGKCYCQLRFSSPSGADTNVTDVKSKLLGFSRSPLPSSGSVSGFSAHYISLCEIPTAYSASPYAASLILDDNPGAMPYYISEVAGDEKIPEAFMSKGVEFGQEALLVHDFSSKSKQQHVNNDLLLCVTPHVGEDMISYDYDDPQLLITFLAYYISMGVSNFLIYNPSGVGLGNHQDPNRTRSQADIWLQTFVTASEIANISLEIVPNYKDIPKDGRYVLGNNTMDDFHVFPWELFPDYCLQRARRSFKFSILLDYTEFIFPIVSNHHQNVGAGSSSGHQSHHTTINYRHVNESSQQSLLKLIQTLDAEHPEAPHFQIQTFVAPHSAICLRPHNLGSSLNQHSKGRHANNGSSVNANSNLVQLTAAIGCRGAHNNAIKSMSPGAARNVVRSGRHLSCNHSHIAMVTVPNPSTKMTAPSSAYHALNGTIVPLKVALSVAYLPTNYAKHDDFRGPLVHSRLGNATSSNVSMELSRHRSNERAILAAIPVTMFLRNAINTNFTSLVAASDNFFGLSQQQQLLQQQQLQNKNYHGSAGKGPYSLNNMKHSHNRNLARLLIFTTVNPRREMKKSGEWARKLLAMSSWVKLATEAPVDEMVVRVLIHVSRDLDCDIIYNEVYPRHLHRTVKRSPLLCIASAQCGHPYFSNIPTTDCLFKLAVNAAHPGEYIMYTNSDMIYFADLTMTFLMAHKQRDNFPGDQFAMVGKRVSVHRRQEKYRNGINEKMPNEINTSMWNDSFIISNLDEISHSVSHQQQKDSEYCQDFFILPNWQFPLKLHPFLVGRAYWDNSMSSLLYTEAFFTNASDTTSILGYRVLPQKKYAYIDVTDTVRGIHTHFDGVDYLFNKRHGAEWNHRLTDYRDLLDRTQIGQTKVADFKSVGDCQARNCTFKYRGSDQTWYSRIWGKY